MQKLKENSFAAIAGVLATVISVLSILVAFLADSHPLKVIMSILTGLLLILAVSFVKEEYVHKFSVGLYLSVTVFLVVKIIVNMFSSSFPNGELTIGNLVLYIPALLPLVSMQISKSMTKYEKVSTEKFILICLLYLLPVVLVLVCGAPTASAVAMMAFAIGIAVLKVKKRISISWRAIAIWGVLFVILLVGLYSAGGSFSNRIDIIFTRGYSDPRITGWLRIFLDELLKNAALVGETYLTIDGVSAIECLSDMDNYNIVILLVKYGWIAFIGALLIYAAFFVFVFKMVSKTNQSAFAKYTSLFLAISLLSQAVYSLISLFLFDGVYINMPFMGEYTINLVNYLSLGVILTFYINRNRTSIIEEIEVNDTEQNKSLFEKLSGMLEAVLEDDENEI